MRCSSIHKLLLMTFCVILLIGCGGGGGAGSSDPDTPAEDPVEEIDPSSITYSKFLSKRAKIVMPYPEDWAILEDSIDPDVVTIFVEPLQGATDQFAENIIVMKAENLDSFYSDLENINTISSSQITIGNNLADEVIFDADVTGINGFDFRFLLTTFEVGEDIYALAYFAERSQFIRNLGVARYMANNYFIGRRIMASSVNPSYSPESNKPALATDGSGVIVISCQSLDDPSQATGRRYDLTGRVTFDNGSLSDEFTIESGGASSCIDYNPGVIFDGSNYMVTYTEGLFGSQKIYAKRIATNGNIIDTAPIHVSLDTTVGNATLSTMTFDGSRSLVLWQADNYSANSTFRLYEIKGAFVDTLGNVSDSFTVYSGLQTLFESFFNPYNLQVSYSNGQYMVIWSLANWPDYASSTPIYGNLIDLSGNLLLTDPLLIREGNSNSSGDPAFIPHFARFPKIASDGNEYLVSWIENEVSGSTYVYAKRVTASGNLLDGDASTPGKLISSPLFSINEFGSSAYIDKHYLNLIFDGEKYIFSWSEDIGFPESGVHITSASNDLEIITEQEPIFGTFEDNIDFNDEEFINFLTLLREPSSIISLNDQYYFVWYSSSNYIDGWSFSKNRCESENTLYRNLCPIN